MNFINLIKEELNIQFVNKTISDVEQTAENLKDLANKNQAIAGPIQKEIASIEKGTNQLKTAIAEYIRMERIKNKSGVGTQQMATKTPKTVTPPSNTATPNTVATNVKKI